MSTVNPYAPPETETVRPPTSGDSDPTMIEMWRQGKDLVFRRGAEFPDRCVKSNEPAEGQRLRRSLHWHHPAIYFAILAHILIFLILAVVLGKKAKVDVGLCEEWQTRRRLRMTIAWLGVVGSLGACFLPAMNPDLGMAVLFGILGILGFGIYGLLACRLVRARRIEGDYIWLRGVCPEFLDELPEFLPQ